MTPEIEAEALTVIDQAVRAYEPSHVMALFSGGHDSLCATHIASRHPRFSGVVHVNTTIGIKETHDFVVDTCREHGWPLKEYRPPVAYRDIVLEHGFPGPGGHLFMYTRLKERCLDQMMREHKTHRLDRIVLVTGVRLQESARRMGHVKPIVRHKAKVWTAPILNWSADNKLDYMAQHSLKPNPVVKLLCMSGECLCGSFAQPGEISQIEQFYPQTAAFIRRLEAEAAARGLPSEWGKRPPRKPDPKQPSLGLCWSCEAKTTDPV